MPHSVAELQAENVTFELECIDRMCLNCHVPQLTSAGGVAAYFRHHKGHRFASTKDAVETSEAFRRNVFDFAKRHDIPVQRFAKGQRKDDVMLGMPKDFREPQGVVFIGVAQAWCAEVRRQQATPVPPFSPTSGLAQRLFQEPPAKSKFLAAKANS